MAGFVQPGSLHCAARRGRRILKVSSGAHRPRLSQGGGRVRAGRLLDFLSVEACVSVRGMRTAEDAESIEDGDGIPGHRSLGFSCIAQQS